MTVLEEDLLYCANNIPKDFYNSSFLITGATGLIGSLIIRSILTCNKINNSNISVFALVRNKEKVEEMYKDFLPDGNISFIYGDVLNELKIDSSVDYIIHAASQTTSKEMVNHPVETSKTSLIGTVNILDFAVCKHVKGFLYLSSMEAFGECHDEHNRLKEEDLGYINLTNIRNCYPESKRMCELLCTCYAKEFGINTFSARLAQVFGAGISKNENRVFAQFTKSALSDENIILHTDGTSWGNYCYTSDTITALFTILKNGKSGGTYTVVNESNSIMIKDMAELIIKIVDNQKSKLIFDIPEDSNKFGYAPKTVMKLSSSKLNKLGWTPHISLEQMYERLIQYIKEELL